MDFGCRRNKLTAFLLGTMVFTVMVFASSAVRADGERYQIKFKPGYGDRVEREVKGMQGKRLKRRGKKIRRLMAADLTAAQLKRLRRSRGIESIEVDERRYLMAETTPYGLPMVQASAARARKSLQSPSPLSKGR